MIYGWQGSSDWVSTGQGELRKAGTGLEVGQAPRATAVAWGEFVSGAWHSPTARAGPDTKLHVQFPQPPSFLNLELCFKAASVMLGRLSTVVYACFSMTQKRIFVIL